MTRRLIVLLVGGAGLWLLAAGPAYALAGTDGLLQSGMAALLVRLIPMAVTQLWCDVALAQKPEQQLLAVFGGTGVRSVVVLVGGMALYYGVPIFQTTSFWLWIVGFYLGTLALEIALVVRRQAELDIQNRDATRQGTAV